MDRLIGAREPTELIRRYEDLKDKTDVKELFESAISACSGFRIVDVVCSKNSGTMRVCGYAVTDEHVLDDEMTQHDCNHYETIMTFLQWAHIGVETDAGTHKS